jgi:hypothetical protein
LTVRRTIALLVAVALVAVVAPSLSAPPASAGAVPFEATISRLDRETRELMIGRSWHEGCPVGLGNLRSIRLTYWGFDREAHVGRLVVHRRWADAIVDVFRALYEERFPIRRMVLVDRYDADDRRSMRHDNTSAFNCRFVAGTTTWSQHAFGRAIDVNPVENPYVRGSYVSPPSGRPYADRSRVRRGMIFEGDAVWQAFADVGWEWGGTWTSAQDYQHFSANGS